MMDWSCEAISASSEQHFATRRLSRWGKRWSESCAVTSLFIWINVPFGGILIILNFSFSQMWEFRPNSRVCELFSTLSFYWFFSNPRNSQVKKIILWPKKRKQPFNRNVQSVQVNSLVPCQRGKAHWWSGNSKRSGCPLKKTWRDEQRLLAVVKKDPLHNIHPSEQQSPWSRCISSTTMRENTGLSIQNPRFCFYC